MTAQPFEEVLHRNFERKRKLVERTSGYAVDGPFVFLQTPTGVSVVSPPGPIIDADELLHCSELVSSLHRKLRAT